MKPLIKSGNKEVCSIGKTSLRESMENKLMFRLKEIRVSHQIIFIVLHAIKRSIMKMYFNIIKEVNNILKL